MTAAIRAVAADVVAEAIRDVATAGSDADLGDILCGALAGVIWMWLKAGKDPHDMKERLHQTADQQFELLIPAVIAEKSNAAA